VGEKMSLSILLVDDSNVNLKVTSLMLKKLGHQVDLATNGIEAIEALEHRSYDVVFMDIQMPEMDGLEATKIIRQRWHQGPKIIVMTSLDNYREFCLEAGADDFLAKPLGIEKLREAIKCQVPISSFDEFVSNNLGEIIAF
jgi:CheY-like chemotaxis protein